MSLQAYLLDWSVKRQIRAKLGATVDVARVRRSLGEGAFPAPKGVVYRQDRIGGVEGEWARAEGGGPAPTLLYLHGGGFIACSPRTHRPITGAFALRGFDVFAPDYRLAPEHRFPAGLDDVVAVWTDLSRRGPVVVAGDSAGGNLALALILRARAAGLPLPNAAVLFSPATDMLGGGESRHTNATRDAMFYPPLLVQLRAIYLDGADPADPMASPLHADLAGLPPLLFHVGEREILRDDSLRFAAKARAAGVHVELKVWPVVPHVWQIAHSILPEGRRSLDLAARFLTAHLTPRSPA